MRVVRRKTRYHQTLYDFPLKMIIRQMQLLLSMSCNSTLFYLEFTIHQANIVLRTMLAYIITITIFAITIVITIVIIIVPIFIIVMNYNNTSDKTLIISSFLITVFMFIVIIMIILIILSLLLSPSSL